MRNLRKITAMVTIFTIVCLLIVFSFNNIALAASCTADCGGGESVTCSGSTCVAMDGRGCVGWYSFVTEFSYVAMCM